MISDQNEINYIDFQNSIEIFFVKTHKMFILFNLKRAEPLNVEKINNRHKIHLDTKHYDQYAIEKPTEDNLVICDSEAPDRILNPINITISGFFEFFTVIKDHSRQKTEPLSFEDLQSQHGSKISQKEVKFAGQREGYLNIDQINILEFSGHEQILPDFNREAKEIKDIYSFSTMFDSYLLHQIREYDLNEQNLKTGSFEYKSNHKIAFIVLDTILHALKRKYIPDKLPHGNISYDILNQILSQQTDSRTLEYNKVRNYNNIEKMKFIAFALIMILKIKRYKVDLTELPNFHLDEVEIQKILKLLGCKIEKNIAALRKAPENRINRRRK